MSQRVINRHRPLRPGELRASYRRVRRYGHAVDRNPDDWDRPDDLYEYDDHYYGYDRDEHERRWWDDQSFGQLLFELNQRIDASPRFNPLFRGRQPYATSADPDVAPLEVPQISASLEERLAAHLAEQPSADALLAGDDLLDDLRVMHDVAEHRLRNLYGLVDRRHWRSSRDPMVAILLFRPFWIRSPRSWRPPPSGSMLELVASLVAHVFARFPFPRFLLSAWLAPRGAFDLRWFAWTVALAQGGSLRRLHRLAFRGCYRSGFGPLPKKLPAHLSDVPEDCSPADGLMFAEVLRLGGTPQEVRRLRLDDSFRIDPTTLASDSDDRKFWEATVRWVVRHRAALDDLDDDAYACILAWARHRHTERRYLPFCWSGRSVPAALAEARTYRAVLRARVRNLRWSSRGWDRTFTTDDVEWTVEELTTSEALAQESAAMSHCVRMYDRYCWYGRSAIFSVKRQGQRRVTVEIHPSTRTLAQVCGPRNRRPDAQETAVVARWHRGLVTDGSTTEGR